MKTTKQAQARNWEDGQTVELRQMNRELLEALEAAHLLLSRQAKSAEYVLAPWIDMAVRQSAAAIAKARGAQ